VTARGGAESVEALARRIERFLAEGDRFFVEVVALTEEGRYRDVLQAWGLVRQRCRLERDEEGRYRLAAPAADEGGRR
jgi:hypothetical protein